MKNIILLLRLPQWTKNFFIFLPLFFSGQFGNIDLLVSLVVTFISFSLIASSIYCFNDIMDVENDKLHPQKNKRPIASGAISIVQGYIIMISCLCLSILIMLCFGKYQIQSQCIILAVYYLSNILYCVKLKSYAIVDVIIIAFGYVLRVVIGGVSTEILLTEWIIIMSFLLALFLAFSKRLDDVNILNKTGILVRKNVAKYNVEFLNQVLTIIAAIIVVSYLMYTVSPEVTERFNSHYIYTTSIFVLAGIIRYLQLSTVGDGCASPTKILIKDRFIQLCIIGWVTLFSIFIYFT